MTIYNVFSCDAWHTETSKKLLGTYTLDRASERAIRRYIHKKELPKLTEDDVRSLNMHNQTQGREVNFIIEEGKINQDLF